MTTYNIYLDRIEVSFDDSYQGYLNLESILTSLSIHLYNQFLSRPLGKGITYRRMSYLIDDLINVIDFSKSVDEVSVVGILRHSLCFLHHFKFNNFQINLLNHV